MGASEPAIFITARAANNIGVNIALLRPRLWWNVNKHYKRGQLVGYRLSIAEQNQTPRFVTEAEAVLYATKEDGLDTV